MIKLKNEYMLGSDPEFFTIDKNGKAISPAVLIHEGKLKPIGGKPVHFLLDEQKEFKLISDGVAWEVTNKRPFDINSPVDMLHNVKNSVERLMEIADKLDLTVATTPTVEIDISYYQKLMEENYELIYTGFVSGCDSDEDAINTSYVCRTVDLDNYPYRHGGGHIHFSTMGNFLHDLCIPIIRAMAITVGNFTIINSNFPELEKLRCGSYGNPGRYRIQNYPKNYRGLEYRSPSNSWINYTDEMFNEMIENLKLVLYKVETGNLDLLNYLDDTITAFKSYDKVLAKDILEEVWSSMI